jgi:hypothetical protein
MLVLKPLPTRTWLIIALTFATCLTLPACSVSVKDHNHGDNSKVDIETPVGAIHVNEEANVRDTGLAVYPGARQKPKTDHDSKSANVNISSSFFGVKVVAIEYESDDSPDKILAFYQDQLKKYGRVIECRTSKHGGDLSVKAGDHSDSSKPVTCEGGNSGNVVELKVGTEDNQHLVSVEPQGKGSDFALVYVLTRGKEGSI